MKILAVGRNYLEHIKELGNQTPDDPVIFSKPETAILKDNEPFYYPDFSSDVHHEIEVVLKISKMGKNIEEKFAHKYYEEVGLGVRVCHGIWPQALMARHRFPTLFLNRSLTFLILTFP
jgi:acylpyruvate hydrolase